MLTDQDLGDALSCSDVDELRDMFSDIQDTDASKVLDFLIAEQVFEICD